MGKKSQCVLDTCLFTAPSTLMWHKRHSTTVRFRAPTHISLLTFQICGAKGLFSRMTFGIDLNPLHPSEPHAGQRGWFPSEVEERVEVNVEVRTAVGWMQHLENVRGYSVIITPVIDTMWYKWSILDSICLLKKGRNSESFPKVCYCVVLQLLHCNYIVINDAKHFGNKFKHNLPFR